MTTLPPLHAAEAPSLMAPPKTKAKFPVAQIKFTCPSRVALRAKLDQLRQRCDEKGSKIEKVEVSMDPQGQFVALVFVATPGAVVNVTIQDKRQHEESQVDHEALAIEAQHGAGSSSSRDMGDDDGTGRARRVPAYIAAKEKEAAIQKANKNRAMQRTQIRLVAPNRYVLQCKLEELRMACVAKNTIIENVQMQEQTGNRVAAMVTVAVPKEAVTEFQHQRGANPEPAHGRPQDVARAAIAAKEAAIAAASNPAEDVQKSSRRGSADRRSRPGSAHIDPAHAFNGSNSAADRLAPATPVSEQKPSSASGSRPPSRMVDGRKVINDFEDDDDRVVTIRQRKIQAARDKQMAKQPYAHIRVLRPNTVRQRLHILYHGVTHIGRTSSNNPDDPPTAALLDPSVSKTHAKLELGVGLMDTLVDLDSTNRSFLGTHKADLVELDPNREYQVQHNDMIVIGRVVCKLIMGPPDDNWEEPETDSEEEEEEEERRFNEKIDRQKSNNELTLHMRSGSSRRHRSRKGMRKSGSRSSNRGLHSGGEASDSSGDEHGVHSGHARGIGGTNGSGVFSPGCACCESRNFSGKVLAELEEMRSIMHSTIQSSMQGGGGGGGLTGAMNIGDISNVTAFSGGTSTLLTQGSALYSSPFPGAHPPGSAEGGQRPPSAPGAAPVRKIDTPDGDDPPRQVLPFSINNRDYLPLPANA